MTPFGRRVKVVTINKVRSHGFLLILASLRTVRGGWCGSW